MQTSGAAALAGTAGGASIGAGLERLLAASKVSWASVAGSPDAGVLLWVERPFEDRPIRASLELVLTTPRGTVRQPAGELELPGGQSSHEVTLLYPFDDFVVGEYRYRAELRCAGETLSTPTTVRYSVKPFLWFS